MFSNRSINLFVILAFLVLVGYGLAMSISRNNTLGIVLTLISLASACAFIYYLNKAVELKETEESNESAES